MLNPIFYLFYSVLHWQLHWTKCVLYVEYPSHFGYIYKQTIFKMEQDYWIRVDQYLSEICPRVFDSWET